MWCWMKSTARNHWKDNQPAPFQIWFSSEHHSEETLINQTEGQISWQLNRDLLGPTELVRELKVIFSCKAFSSVWRSTWICNHSSLSEFSFILIPSFTLDAIISQDHFWPLLYLVTQNLSSVKSFLYADKVWMFFRGVFQNPLHQQGVLSDPLNWLKEVEGKGHALHLWMWLALPEQGVKFRPHFHQLLQESGSGKLGGAESDVGSHGRKLRRGKLTS